ncbi:MAG: hypothetical protein ACREQY_23330, partial [Candidatus Binatia bacterium]
MLQSHWERVDEPLPGSSIRVRYTLVAPDGLERPVTTVIATSTLMYSFVARGVGEKNDAAFDELLTTFELL